MASASASSSWTSFDHEQLAPVAVRAFTAAVMCVQHVWTWVLMVWYWWRAREGHDLITLRKPYAVLWLMGAIQVSEWISMMLPLLVDARFFCDVWTGKHILYPIHQQALIAQYSVAVWRVLGLIERFETQRISAAVSLRDAGFADGEGDGAGGGEAKPPLAQATTAAATDDDDGVGAAAIAQLVDGNIFQRCLPYLQSRTLAALFCALNVAPTVLYFLTPPHAANRYCPPGDITLAGFQYAFVCVLFGLAFKIRSIDDALWITRELRYAGALLFVHITAYTTEIALIPYFHLSPLATLYTAVIYSLFAWVTMGVPVWYSYSPARLRTRRSDDATGFAIPPELLTLQGVLSSKPARAAFQKHLMMEFSLESLMALDDIAVLKRARPRDDLPIPALAAAGALAGRTLQVPGAAGTAAAPAPPTPPAASASAPAPAVGGGTTPSIGAGPTVVIGSSSAGSAPSTAPAPSPADAAAAAGAEDDTTTAVSAEQARDLALAIYAKYVAAGAPFECNLPSRVTRPLHHEFAALHRMRQRMSSRARNTVQHSTHTNSTNTVEQLPPLQPSPAPAQRQLLVVMDVRSSASTGSAGGGGVPPPAAAPSPSALSLPGAVPARPSARMSYNAQLPTLYGQGTSLALLVGVNNRRATTARRLAPEPATAALTIDVTAPLGPASAAAAAKADVKSPVELASSAAGPIGATAGSAAAYAIPSPAPAAAGGGGQSHWRKLQAAHRSHSSNDSKSGGDSGRTAGPGGVVKNAAYFLAIFDDARTELLTLLSNDSLTRFINSALFEQLLLSRAMASQLVHPNGANNAAATAAALATAAPGSAGGGPRSGTAPPAGRKTSIGAISGGTSGGGPRSPTSGAAAAAAGRLFVAARNAPTATNGHARDVPLPPL